MTNIHFMLHRQVHMTSTGQSRGSGLEFSRDIVRDPQQDQPEATIQSHIKEYPKTKNEHQHGSYNESLSDPDDYKHCGWRQNGQKNGTVQTHVLV